MWQRRRELWQVFHTHPAHADPFWPAGHCQYRPERVCRLLLCQPSVHPSVSAQRGMRRKPEDETKPTGTVPEYKILPELQTLQMSHSALSTSYSICVQKWPRKVEQGEQNSWSVLACWYNLNGRKRELHSSDIFAYIVPSCPNVLHSKCMSMYLSKPTAFSCVWMHHCPFLTLGIDVIMQNLSLLIPLMSYHATSCNAQERKVFSLLCPKLYFIYFWYTFIFLYWKRGWVLLQECQSRGGRKHFYCSASIFVNYNVASVAWAVSSSTH